MSYRLAILLPCRDILHSAFAYDLARLTAYWSARHVPKGGALHLFTSQGTLIADQRQNLVLEALKVEADYVLWCDTDMRFPKDIVDRLHAHGKDVVAANYSTRRVPCKPVAFADASCRNLVYTNADSTGLEEAYAIGMGAMLERADIYKKLALPFFSIGYSQAAQDFFGEDVFHCHKLREVGVKVYIDHDVSKEVRHIGNFEFANEHAEAQREIVEAEGIQTAKRSAA
jgi:hypothetical protein